MSSDNRFSIIELRKLHQQLVENKVVTDENQNLVIEILRVIAEMVVYGDNKSELLFDYFCEKNMLPLFLELMHTENGCPAAVHIQILQTLSILINCVRNDTSLYYLLSNNHINEIILFSHDFEHDEGLRDQFVAFMKSLSLKLNAQTVQFFFIEENCSFPMLSKAIELLNYNEPMVRISSQTTILNVYKVDDVRSREYALQDDVMLQLFIQVIKLMKSQYSAVVKHCSSYWKSCSEEVDEAPLIKIENSLEDTMASIEDWFYYLQDVMDLGIVKLQTALVNQIITELFIPELLKPLEKFYELRCLKGE
jgi:protein CLEC16A